MVRSSTKKKARGDDAFQKRKSKTGRKKLAPVTDTQAEVHARSLFISTSTALSKVNAAQSTDGVNEAPTSSRSLAAAGRQTPAELLRGAAHYKSSQRASSMVALQRLLAADSKLAPTPRHLSDPTEETSPVDPVDRLRIFSVALESMMDSDDAVRRAALALLKSLFSEPQWVCPSGSQPGAAVRARMEEAAVWWSEPTHSSALPAAVRSSQEQERVIAVMRVVHMALTHACLPVRHSGVDLLEALLSAPLASGVLRGACRTVCQQQASMTAGPVSPIPRDPQELEREEEEWMSGLIQRVARLVWKSQHVVVLADLVEGLLANGCGAWEADCEVETVMGSLLSESGQTSACPAARRLWSGTTPQDFAAPHEWRHINIVEALLHEHLISPAANAWKELMELRLQLLRNEKQLARAAAISRVVGTICGFLQVRRSLAPPSKEPITNKQARKQAYATRTLQRQLLDLFVVRVPVTIETLLSSEEKKDETENGVQRANRTSSSPLQSYQRCALACALAIVAAPLAEHDSAWNLLYHFFSSLFPQQSSPGSEQDLSLSTLQGAIDVMLLVNHYSQSSEGESGSTPVKLKILVFIPLVVRAVLRAVSRLPLTTPGSSSSEDDSMVKILFSLHQLLVVLVKAPFSTSAAMQKGGGGGRAVMEGSRALHRVWPLLPRLLFALRARREETTETGEVGSGVPVLLGSQPVLVDMIVCSFFHLLWIVVSSKHPLLSCSADEGVAFGSAAPSERSSGSLTCAASLKRASPSFNHIQTASGPVDGVLARCSANTKELARCLAFYVNAQQSIAVEERGKRAREDDINDEVETSRLSYEHRIHDSYHLTLKKTLQGSD